ncbi:MAG TPA: GMC family oxidoreductase, partial [Acidimicrobiia bacterium]
HTVRVKSRAVVLAAGALNTPAILQRSGLGGAAAGRYLRVHPVTALWGRFDERVEPWTGTLQARFSDQFANLDGHGHGFKFETAPVHPLFPSAFIGWQDGASFKRDVLGLGHLNVAGILLRDRDHGRVVIRKDGSPVWKYRISRFDQGHVRVGVRRAAEMLAESGAKEVITSSIRAVRWVPASGSLETFMEDADAIGYGPNRTSYFSFHQMGSARMGSDPATAVVDVNNETHDTGGLYVMDGSCFPTASGVNPMLSIAAVAHRGATILADRMG